MYQITVFLLLRFAMHKSPISVKKINVVNYRGDFMHVSITHGN